MLQVCWLRSSEGEHRATLAEDSGRAWLAYPVGAGSGTFSDVGVFTIYAGTSPKQLDEVLDLSLTEVRRIVNEVVPDDELELVKEQAISAVLLGLESSSARAGTLARQEIIHNRHISPDEMIQSIEAVTSAEIQDVARKFFTTEKLALGALGNLTDFASFDLAWKSSQRSVCHGGSH